MQGEVGNFVFRQPRPQTQFNDCGDTLCAAKRLWGGVTDGLANSGGVIFQLLMLGNPDEQVAQVRDEAPYIDSLWLQRDAKITFNDCEQLLQDARHGVGEAQITRGKPGVDQVQRNSHCFGTGQWCYTTVIESVIDMRQNRLRLRVFFTIKLADFREQRVICSLPVSCPHDGETNVIG